jgi:anti-sigma factor RsiW
MKSDPSDSAFRRLLADWRLEPPPDPRFAAAVRRRVRAQRPAAAWPDYLRVHALVVAGAVALAITLGAWGGSGRARTQSEADRRALAAAYVHQLDARWMAAR